MAADQRPKIRFRPHLTVFATGPAEITVQAAFEYQTFEDRLFVELAPLLDGRWSRPEILDRLTESWNPFQVEYTITRLVDQDILEEEPFESLKGDALLGLFAKIPGGRRARLKQSKLEIQCIGSIPKSTLQDSCRTAGIQVADRGDRCLIVTDDILNPQLNHTIETVRQRHLPWMVAAVSPAWLHIGPASDAESSSCWACTRARLEAARLTKPSKGQPLVPARPVPHSTAASLRTLIATAAARWLADDPKLGLDMSILTLDFATIGVQRHSILRRPCCPICGKSDVETEERPKSDLPFSRDLRAARPDALRISLQHHLSPLTGIVGRLAPHRSDFAGEVNIWVATVRDARDRAEGQRGLASRCAGTGRTTDAARLSAVCEAVERASGLDYGCEPRHRASYTELGDAAMHPARCLMFSKLQYENREKLNRSQAGSNYIPQPFDEDRKLEWTRLHSLVDGRDRWMPTAMCYFDGPRDPAHDFCRADSNGCAAGSCFDEAILHGFFELVERDAAAIWWYNRIRRPGLDLEAVDDPELQPVPSLCRQHGLRCWALDLTTDLGIPVFVALCGRPGEGLTGGALGFGAHLDPKIALRRALSEMSLLLANRLPDRSSNLFFSSKATGPYLEPDPFLESTPLITPSSPIPSSPQSALALCVDRVAALGLDFLVLDQTRPGYGLSVARVVVPGLRSFWARFAPGRLYDVPVLMAWLDRPRSEDELNPSHLLI